MFSMEEKQDYHLYIEDLFGQRENPSVLYIDLVACPIFTGTHTLTMQL